MVDMTGNVRRKDKYKLISLTLSHSLSRKRVLRELEEAIKLLDKCVKCLHGTRDSSLPIVPNIQ